MGEIFEQTYQLVLGQYTNVIVYLAVIGTTGVIGNSVTIWFYSKEPRKPVNILVLGLAVTDLLASLMALMAIAETILNIKFKSRLACKLAYVFYYWFVSASVMLISIIAQDRYMRLCKPFGRQFTLKIAVGGILAVWCFTILLSFRSFLTVDIVQTEFKFGKTVVKPDSTMTYLNYTGDITLPTLSQSISEVYTTDSWRTAKSSISNTVTISANNVTSIDTSTSVPLMTSIGTATSVPLMTSIVTTISVPLMTSIGKTTSVPLTTSIGTTTSVLLSNRTSVVDSVTQGIQAINSRTLDTIDVHICAFVTDPRLRVYVVAFHISDMVMVSFQVAHIVFSYATVIRMLVKHVKKTKFLHEGDKQKKNKNTMKYSPGTDSSENTTISTISVHDPPTSSESTNSLNTTKPVVAKSIRRTATKNAPGSIKKSEIQITIASLVISFGFLVSFIPYFISTIHSRLISTEDLSLDASSNLMIRCAFINSVLNPFIYYIFSSAYRKFVNDLVCVKVTRCKRSAI